MPYGPKFERFADDLRAKGFREDLSGFRAAYRAYLHPEKNKIVYLWHPGRQDYLTADLQPMD